jgi:aspartyl-tRNA(Asn)/glutamyl-tRNA(Gln) amidotransferase subunit C
MSLITTEEVKEIAALSRVALKDTEVEKSTGDISGILSNFSAIQSIDTSSTQSADDASGLTNVARKDVVQEHILCTPSDLLSRAPRTSGSYLEVLGVFSESEVS